MSWWYKNSHKVREKLKYMNYFVVTAVFLNLYYPYLYGVKLFIGIPYIRVILITALLTN